MSAIKDSSLPGNKGSVSVIDPEKQRHDQATDENEVITNSQKGLAIEPSIDHVAENRLVRKLDFFIIPPVMLLYFASFLDRVNIGNARLYHLERDLHLRGSQYQTAVSLLFVTYVICETPSNLVIKKLRPSRWIAFIVLSWGIVATLTGVVQSYGGLIVCRLLMGALEAGLFPGTILYPAIFVTSHTGVRQYS